MALELRDEDLASWPPASGLFFREAWLAWRDGERWHDEGAAGFLLGRFR